MLIDHNNYALYCIGATSELLIGFNFEKDLVELFQQLIKSKDFSYDQLKGFIEAAKSQTQFKAAAKKVPSETTIPLLKLYSERGQQLLELLQIFSFDESQIIENEQQLFCGILEGDSFVYGHQNLMKKISKSSRTQCLAACLKHSDPKQAIKRALVVLHSGEIDPTRIDLSLLSDELLHHIQSVHLLLKHQVDPCGLKTKRSSKSPLKRLAIICPHRFDKKLNQTEIVQTMKLLIDNGAEVEDLNCYHRGNVTTPLHVATELTIATGESC